MDFEKDYLDEKEPLEVEEEFEKPELTKGATRDTDPQYFTNIDGIYAKDAAGRAAVEELRTLVTGYSETVLKQVGVYNWDGLVNSVLVTASEMAEYDSFIFVYGYCSNSGDRTLLTNWGFTTQTITSSVLVDGNNIKLNIASGNSAPVCFTCGGVDNDFKLKHIDGSMSGYTFGIAKVIGIKYPKLYVAPQTLNSTRNEPAEEDEMR